MTDSPLDHLREETMKEVAPTAGYPTHDGSRGGWYAAALKGAPHKRSIKRAVERRYPFLRFEWRSAGEHIDGVFERADAARTEQR